MASKKKNIIKNNQKDNPYNSKNLLILIPIAFVITFTYYHQKPKIQIEANCKAPISSYDIKQNAKKTRLPMQASYTSINLQTREKPSTRSKVWGVNGAQSRKTARNIDQKKLLADNSSDMSLQKKTSQCKNNDPFYVSRLQIGPNYTRVNLKPDSHTSFNGNLWGAQGAYEYKPANDLYAGVTFSWRQGDTDGSSDSTRYLLYLDTQERIGYTFASEHKKWLVTLFSGLGFLHLGHHLKPSSGDSIRYRYNEFYAPLGLISNYSCSSWFSWGLGLTWMPQVFPTVNSSIDHGNNWSLRYKLANFFVEMPLDFAATKNRKFHITFKPFYEAWNDGHSTGKSSSGVSFGLQSNHYNFWGADLNFGYFF